MALTVKVKKGRSRLVVRAAPQWAWDIIDETLALDALSSAFDHELRDEIGLAATALHPIELKIGVDILRR